MVFKMKVKVIKCDECEREYIEEGLKPCACVGKVYEVDESKEEMEHYYSCYDEDGHRGRVAVLKKNCEML